MVTGTLRTVPHAGIGFWMIRRADLTERRFDRVQLIMQMSP